MANPNVEQAYQALESAKEAAQTDDVDEAVRQASEAARAIKRAQKAKEDPGKVKAVTDLFMLFWTLHIAPARDERNAQMFEEHMATYRSQGG